MSSRVVIVGGGFGGLNAARALDGAADVRVTLLDRHNYHLFQPLLYQVATAALSPGDIASPIRWILRHQKNVEVLLANVTADRSSRPPRAHRSTAIRSWYDYLDPCHRLGARVLRASRMGGARTRTEDARRCAGDATAHAAGVRSRRARDRSREAGTAAHLRHRRRRADRRRTGGRAGRDRASVARPRFPPHPHRVGAHHPRSKAVRTCSRRFPIGCASPRAARSNGWVWTCGPDRS